MQAIQKNAESSTTSDTHVTSKDGTRIAFDRVGSGPALVLVNGALSDRGMLRDNPLVPMLAKNFTVYSYDRRGRGESADTQPYAVDREIEDLEAVIAHAGTPVYVFGTSSGGALSLQAAAKLGPTKIAKLAVYEPPYGQDAATYGKQKSGVAEAIATGAPGDAAELFLTGIGTPPEALEKMKKSPQWEAMKKMDFTLNYDFAVLGDGSIPADALHAITVPTLVLTGEKTLAFMGPTADRIAKELRDGKHQTLPGQTHQVDAKIAVPLLTEFFRPASS